MRRRTSKVKNWKLHARERERDRHLLCIFGVFHFDAAPANWKVSSVAN